MKKDNTVKTLTIELINYFRRNLKHPDALRMKS